MQQLHQSIENYLFDESIDSFQEKSVPLTEIKSQLNKIFHHQITKSTVTSVDKEHQQEPHSSSSSLLLQPPLEQPLEQQNEKALQVSLKIEELLDTLAHMERKLDLVISKYTIKENEFDSIKRETQPKIREETRLNDTTTTTTEVPSLLTSNLDIDTVIDYARRISRYTSGPPQGTKNRIAYPPIPQDSHMKLSMLFHPPQLTVEKTKEDEIMDQALPIVNPFEILGSEGPEKHEDEEELLDLDF